MASIKEKLDIIFNENVLEEKLEDVMGERFGRYSKYIIQERAIPDSRDGLKPVQRRILYAMYKLGMSPDKPYKKSARIAGEVMGKYHPHGDSSIYEAMVRMSQDWKTRVPLISMHGNNGSIDGDSAAAMRYTEARLSPASMLLLEGIEKRTVDLVPNFDDTELEPIVLPAKFPNMLVNGATGIAAGYATNIPPHNLKEVIKATIYRIDHPNCGTVDLMNFVKGPDFPTGGIVQGRDGLLQAYETGRGKIVIQSKTQFEELSKGQYQIIVTEIPYEVNKALLVKKIDQLRIEKKFDSIIEVRDESDREGLRIAIDLKKGVSPEFVLNYLLLNTDLRINYNFNVIAIHNQRPTQMGLGAILDAYINHQKEVVTNRSNYDLTKAKKRLHVVMGLMKMVSILDEVIAVIRASKGKANAKENIRTQFGFSEEQAEAIVTLQLYRLSSTDIFELEQEEAELNKQIINLTEILSNEKSLLSLIKSELKEVASKVGDERKTQIEDDVNEIKIAKTDLIVDEEVMVSVSRLGYIKRSSLRSFNQTPLPGLKENDSLLFRSQLSTHTILLVFTSLGNYVYIPIYELEDAKWKDMGTYLGNIVPIEANERIVNVFAINNFEEDKTLLFATKMGIVKQTKLSDFNVNRYSKAIRAMKLQDNDSVVSVDMTSKYQEVVLFSKRGKALRYYADEISVVGTTAGGIKGINLAPNDELSAAIYTRSTHDCVLLTSRGNLKRVKIESIPMSKRNKVGSTIIKEIKGNPHYIMDAVTMSYVQYRENVLLYVLTDTMSITVKSFDVKYSTTDSGKPFISAKQGNPLRLFIDYIEDVDIFDEGKKTPITPNYDESILEEIEADDSELDEEKFQKFTRLSLFDGNDF